MKLFRKTVCILMLLGIAFSLAGPGAAASEETAAPQEAATAKEVLAIGDPLSIAENAVTTAEEITDEETSVSTETDNTAESTEPVSTEGSETADEAAEEEVTAETENNAETLGVDPTAGTWDTCEVLVEGKLCYDYAYQVLDKLNALRAANGLNELVMDTALLEHAMLRAAETALYWEHTSPDGSTHNYGCDILYYHENIAHVYSTPTAAYTGWYNSSGHRENMLNSTLKTVGIGVFYIDGNYYWVQDFSRNRSSTAYKSDYTDKWTTYTISVADWLIDDYATVKLSDNTLTLGQTASFSVRYTLYPAFDLPASGLTYKSSNKSVCTVSEDGTVTAVGGGTATITAWYPGYEDGAWTFTVTVSIPAHDCDYDGVVTTAPTCETAGLMTYTCSICRKSYTAEIAATGHTLSDEGELIKAPTCTSMGKVSYACANCDYTKITLLSPTGHSYDNGIVTVYPTAESDGSIVYTCANCGSTKTGTFAFLYGDVNADGTVNSADLVCLMKHLSGSCSDINPAAADVTADDTIDLLDVIRLARHLADSNIELG